MSSGDADGPESIAGDPVDDAVEAVLERGEEHERTTARERLEPVVADGVVSREALDEQVAEVSKAVSTVETRTELAGTAYEDAAETAEPVADIDVVARHLDRLASELDNLREWRDHVAARLDAATDRKNWGSIYETTTDLQDVRDVATRVQRGADALRSDLEAFEQWIEDPELRYEEVDADLDALEGSIGDIAAGVDRLAEAVDDATGGGDERSPADDGSAEGPDGDDGDAAGLADDDVGVAWADTVMRVRVLTLFVDDVRAELADLRTWAERADEPVDPVDDLEERVAEIADRRAAVQDRLDGVTRSEWRERFADDLDDFYGELDAYDPPVAWDAIQETLEDYRAELGAS